LRKSHPFLEFFLGAGLLHSAKTITHLAEETTHCTFRWQFFFFIRFFFDKGFNDGFGGHACVTKRVVKGGMSTGSGIHERANVILQLGQLPGVSRATGTFLIDDDFTCPLFGQTFLNGQTTPTESSFGDSWTALTIIAGVILILRGLGDLGNLLEPTRFLKNRGQCCGVTSLQATIFGEIKSFSAQL